MAPLELPPRDELASPPSLPLSLPPALPLPNSLSHQVVGAGKTDGAMDAGNLLKPMLARGQLRCIGATTLDEYKKYVEKDPALERRFQQVLVDAPSVEDTISILRGLKVRFLAPCVVGFRVSGSGFRVPGVGLDGWVSGGGLDVGCCPDVAVARATAVARGFRTF